MKKEKYVDKVGITGIGKDYHVYHMNFGEMILGFVVGFAAGFAGMQIFFNTWWVSLILGIAIGIVAVPIYRKILLNKRHKKILLQFRDLLDALANSFSAGRNTADAFADGHHDIILAYGDNCIMGEETDIIVRGLQNNFTIEDLLHDMADRCDVAEMNSFAEIFAISNRLGGNLKRIVTDSRDMINAKLETEMEIQTMISGSKGELDIMTVMPFIVVFMINSMGEQTLTANTPINVLIKLIAIAMFVVAYVIGLKITDIKA